MAVHVSPKADPEMYARCVELAADAGIDLATEGVPIRVKVVGGVGPTTKLPPRPKPVPVGEPGRWEMYIPDWHPCSDNKLKGNHYAVNRLKKKDAKIIDGAGRAYCVKLADRPRRLTVTLHYANRRHRKDTRNVHKSLDDALVMAGLLWDDNPDWQVDGGTHEDFERGEKGTTILLEDVG